MTPDKFLFIAVWIVVTSFNTVAPALTGVDANLTNAGDDAVLQCQTDQPNVEVQFLRKGVDLATDKSGKYSINNDNNSINKTLTVKKVGEQDLGEYLCRTSSPPQTASVFLYSKPVINPIQVPTNLIEGETLHLTCSTWGLPTPTCTWYKDGKRIEDSDQGVSFAGLVTSSNVTIDRAQLTIIRMNRSDQTYYTCSADDGTSKTLATAYVRVKDRLAAVWPAIGIVIVIVLTIIIIIFAERRRRKNEAKLHPQ